MTTADLIAIVGGGQMGLVLADALAEAGHHPRIWGPHPDRIRALAETRHSDRLPGFTLPSEVALTADDANALIGADVIVNAIPTQYIRSAWKRLASGGAAGVPVLCVSKGIERGTRLRPTEVIAEAMGDDPASPRAMAALSGPTIAAELARRLPATMVAASTDPALSELAQQLFAVDWLRIYRHDDLIGVEIAGAAKNVIALAAGMVDGLGAGDNAKSALLARGLAEMARLGVALGARVDTFFGIAGVGDLATTCFSPCGRNRTCGERLGQGERLEDILASTSFVVEGVPTTESIHALAAEHSVEMPIVEAVHAILEGRLAPREAIQALMRRSPKAERIG